MRSRVQRRVKQRLNSQVNGMSADKRYYLTTPIYYVNDVPHIGHAYTTLACDVLARFKRFDGFDVHFLTGTDEHGQKVEKSAAAAGIEPQEFTDRVSQNFRDLANAMNYSHDDFIRTTEERHIKASQAIWTKLKENGHIYLGSYAGWYAVRDEAFYDESELTEGEGGTKTAPSGAEVEWVEEPSYFFDLSKWQEPLLKFYEDNPDFIAPKSRRNEVMSFVKGGLRDLSISRTSFKWGVPVPGDPDHIMYVWLDALTNYLTAVGYPDESSDDYLKYWPTSLHMVGKDILRFHAVYWPAFLMGAGIDVPKRVFAHGWWTNEGQKISKSVGNIIDPNEIVDTYGLDQVRYFLMKEVPFGNDGDFSHRAMISRINSDLANDLGNLCQRVLSMIHKNCAAQVPACQSVGIETYPVYVTLTDIRQALAKVRVHMDNQVFHQALEEIWRIIRDANRTVDESAPWALRKTDPEAMASVLYILAEIIRHFAILLQPFMPESCGKMLDQLAVPEDARGFEQLHNNSGTAFDENALSPGTPLPKPEGIFPRFIEVTIAE
jgi:methionyl-tRNA synthetase